MGYSSININHNEGLLCEQISFSEPGEQSYTRGSTITLSDARLSRDRQMIVMAVNYEEDQDGGISTTVSGFSTEYEYTRKAPDYDISFLTMTAAEIWVFENAAAANESEVYYLEGDSYGVGGWSMHSIMDKIVMEWMGLALVNNLPDYWISDFSISLGSTFFEAMSSLISEFEPFIILTGGTLYILERNGAGALGAGQLTLTNMSLRSVDREYIPAPGCIKVEGQEGKYIAAKDPAQPIYAYFIGDSEENVEEETLPEFQNGRITEISSGEIKIPETVGEPKTVGELNAITDPVIENYLIIDTYYTDMYGDKWAKISRVSTIKSVIPKAVDGKTLTSITRQTSASSYHSETLNFEYNSPVIQTEEEIWEAVTHTHAEGQMVWTTYSTITTQYTHNMDDWTLRGQSTVKKELYIHDTKEDIYDPYDPRDFNLQKLEENEVAKLVITESRVAKYSMINPTTYAVDTIITSFKYSEEEEAWAPLYTFEHDMVEAGGQQQVEILPDTNGEISGGARRTLQVYASDCPFLPNLAVMDEPAKIFNVSTPDWDDIEDCYVYLSALINYEFQTAQVTTPIIDPLPLMAIAGLGSILSSGISGSHYVTGYTINIDPNGYTTNLTLEARRA